MSTPRRSNALSVLLCAAVVGGALGAGSLAISDGGRADPTSQAHMTLVATGITRARLPQAGDHWGGCNDARAAGTAPIYRGEPGYRETMDGDGDGIACEPIQS
ncbi:hypothetical protein QE361_001300 [Sphingomonas sp. SORGH_AS802]|nr:hypothetical protein [Sphingomonas sp. SORGH_AS_0438]MDR6134325.1 hypothetical protein [Sphingomonas sp. SORGH_AS_0802]